MTTFFDIRSVNHDAMIPDANTSRDRSLGQSSFYQRVEKEIRDASKRGVYHVQVPYGEATEDEKTKVLSLLREKGYDWYHQRDENTVKITW